MAEELEDAVTFLERAKEIYPNVTSLLNTNQLLALDTDPTAPYSDQKTANEEFIKLTEAYFVTKHSVDTTKNTLRAALMEPHAKDKQIDVDDEDRVIECLKKVTEGICSSQTFQYTSHGGGLVCIHSLSLRLTCLTNSCPYS